MNIISLILHELNSSLAKELALLHTISEWQSWDWKHLLCSLTETQSRIVVVSAIREFDYIVEIRHPQVRGHAITQNYRGNILSDEND